jgi:hypothetical protein
LFSLEKDQAESWFDIAGKAESIDPIATGFELPLLSVLPPSRPTFQTTYCQRLNDFNQEGNCEL